MQEYLPIILLAVSGFLVGGAYAMWKTAKVVAVVIGLTAVVAAAAGVLWMWG